jgi:hypothetical protein
MRLRAYQVVILSWATLALVCCARTSSLSRKADEAATGKVADAPKTTATTNKTASEAPRSNCCSSEHHYSSTPWPLIKARPGDLG